MTAAFHFKSLITDGVDQLAINPNGSAKAQIVSDSGNGLAITGTGVALTGNNSGAFGISLSGVTTGTGAFFYDSGSMIPNPTMVVITSAGVSAGVILLEGSLDATNWFSIQSSATLGASACVLVSSSARFVCRYLRARVTTTVVGGTATAHVTGG